MENSKFKIQNLRLIMCILVFAFCCFPLNAQSTDQSFPTAVTGTQINGTIKARDLGDSRLTTYFYVFGGNQGDIFLNVVTKNFDGDIDVFTLNGLRPLTKIRVFSDNSDNETGRIIYLRQPEKLLLRIEGRSPNDDPAAFQIKFAGSFVAEKTPSKEIEAPQVKTENQGEVEVNSVGTIIRTKPKPSPKPSATPKEAVKKEESETTGSKTEKSETTEKKEETPRQEESKKLEVVITDNLEKPQDVKPVVENQEKTAETTKTEKSEENKEEAKAEESAKKEINPLANIKLTVVFKDGKKIERAMSEILSVNVDKGILTVIEKDGTIGRYSILDLVEFTIK